MKEFLTDPLFLTIAMRTLAAIGGMVIAGCIIFEYKRRAGDFRKPEKKTPPPPITRTGERVIIAGMLDLTDRGIR